MRSDIQNAELLRQFSRLRENTGDFSGLTIRTGRDAGERCAGNLIRARFQVRFSDSIRSGE